MPKQVSVYTTQYCPYCTRVKELLRSKKIEFTEVDLTNDSAKRDELQEKTGWMTVPMIFIGDDFIGGSHDLHALAASGELDKKLKG